MVFQIRILLAAIFVGTAVNAGPLFPYPSPYRPLGAVRSYFYSGAAPLAPVAPVAAAPLVAAPLPAVFGDYYSYATAAAFANPGYAASSALANPTYPYSYPYWNLLAGYPLRKK